MPTQAPAHDQSIFAFIIVEPGLSPVGLGFRVCGLGFRDSNLIIVEPGLSPVGRQLISVAANRWHP